MTDRDEVPNPTPLAPASAANEALAAESAANQALAIAKVPPPPDRTGSTIAMFIAGTAIGIVGFATGLGVVACVGAAVMGACIQRLSSAN